MMEFESSSSWISWSELHGLIRRRRITVNLQSNNSALSKLEGFVEQVGSRK